MLRNALRPVFSRLRAFWGTLIIKRAQPSLFPCEPDGKLGALAQKRGFACARNLFHAFLGELTPAERRELRKTPLSALWAAQSEFSSLRGNEGHTLIKRRANSPFLRAAPRCKVKKAKAWFCLFRICLERQKVANSPARRSARVPTHCHPERSGEQNVSRAVERVSSPCHFDRGKEHGD